jgi:predicted ABC-type ATPase
MPTLYLITGSNGAGKSTVGPDYLPQQVRDTHIVFDGDKLYTGKVSALWPEQMKSIKEAKKIAAEFIVITLESLLENALKIRKTLFTKDTFRVMPPGTFQNVARNSVTKFKCCF